MYGFAFVKASAVQFEPVRVQKDGTHNGILHVGFLKQLGDDVLRPPVDQHAAEVEDDVTDPSGIHALFYPRKRRAEASTSLAAYRTSVLINSRK